MDFNKLTQKSQEAFSEAQNMALRHGHTDIDGEHLLWSLLNQQDGIVIKLLNKMNKNS